jgi:hypothetical protein
MLSIVRVLVKYDEPMMKTLASRSISSSMALFKASRTVICSGNYRKVEFSDYHRSMV